MKLGIMQPYFFPYIGYWQLINEVDKYIVLDDVTFIKQGYINRNNILSQNKGLKINILVDGISSNKLICDHELNKHPKWRKKLLSTFRQNYSKAPYFDEIFPLVESCVLYEDSNLANYLFFQISTIAEYLGIDTEIVLNSKNVQKCEYTAQSRILEMAKEEKATTYINAIGGQELYSKELFKNNGIELKFLETKSINYKQFGDEFIPSLSIIDILMFNSLEEVKQLLNKKELI